MRRVAVLALVSLVLPACRPARYTGYPTPTERGSPLASTSPPRSTPASLRTGLTRFPNCTALASTLRAQALSYLTPYGIEGPSGLDERLSSINAQEGQAASSGPVRGMAPQDLAGGAPSSTTNVQEEGVDEPDLIETDGSLVYAVDSSGGSPSEATVRSLIVAGRASRFLGSIPVAPIDAELLLTPGRLVVLGHAGAEAGVKGGGPETRMGTAPVVPPPLQGGETVIQILDIADPAHMRILDTLRLDGSYVAARAAGGLVRIVIERPAPAIAFTPPAGPNPADTERALEANRSALASAPAAAWIPTYRLFGHNGTRSGSLSLCTDTYAPPTFSGPSTVTVVTIDPKNPVPRHGATVVGSAGIVYASASHLYVTSVHEPLPQPLMGIEPQGAEAPPAGAPVAPRPAPASGSGTPAMPAPAAPRPATTTTDVHEFDIFGPEATYVASGTVPGTLLNQYAMSEWQGHLRVAWTSDAPWGWPSPPSESGVSVLERRAGVLAVTGEVRGLGKGERIYAVRFVGPVGYVVTFRQTDPLYTIDLSRPNAPRLAGQLSSPGFSAYLHPVEDHEILGVGEQTDAAGRVHDDQGDSFGTKISLYDVSDPAHPRDVADHVIAGSEPLVGRDPHAFLWWSAKHLVLLPVGGWSPGSQTFRGTVALVVGPGLKEAGRITPPSPAPSSAPSPPLSFPILRSAVSGDAIVSLAPEGILVSHLDTLDEEAWLSFS